jgi:hypothetical protein
VFRGLIEPRSRQLPAPLRISTYQPGTLRILERQPYPINVDLVWVFPPPELSGSNLVSAEGNILDVYEVMVAAELVKRDHNRLRVG